MTPNKTAYRGRFAPSPTGPLHRGSLAAALASFLDARLKQGDWLLRIEDIDPPRDIAGADLWIKQTLASHGMHWDEAILYQSTRLDRYQQIFETLQSEQLLYRCECTRRRLREIEREYDNHCRPQLRQEDWTRESHIPPSKPEKHAANFAWRFNIAAADATAEGAAQYKPDGKRAFFERLSTQARQFDDDDFIVRRKDGLFSYNLAVVVDDIDQSITDIVRGDDLFTMTSRQITLSKALHGGISRYLHIPVVKDDKGFKFSKQHGAEGVDNASAIDNLKQAAQDLNLLDRTAADDLVARNCEELLAALLPFWQQFLLRHGAV